MRIKDKRIATVTAELEGLATSNVDIYAIPPAACRYTNNIGWEVNKLSGYLAGTIVGDYDRTDFEVPDGYRLLIVPFDTEAYNIGAYVNGESANLTMNASANSWVLTSPARSGDCIYVNFNVK